MNLAQIDFQQLSIKHILYKSKVRSALYGGPIDYEFFSDKNGPIGGWIYTKGMTLYGKENAMRNLEKAHREINAYVTELLNLYKKGHIEEARENLKVLEKYSKTFLNALSELEAKIMVFGS